MRLEIIILRELTHTQKDKYHVSSHLWVPDFIQVLTIHVRGLREGSMTQSAYYFGQGAQFDFQKAHDFA